MKSFKNPIRYKSLTIKGRCNKKDFIGKNKNKHSIIDGFITLTIPVHGKNVPLCIPVKMSTHYHGNIKQYMKSNNVYMYTLCFDEKRHRLNVNICRTEEREYYDLKDTDEVIGIDVNVKNNIFALSNGQAYQMTDKMQNTVDNYLKLCLYEDGLRKNHNEKIEKYIETVEKEQCKTLNKEEKTEIKK